MLLAQEQHSSDTSNEVCGDTIILKKTTYKSRMWAAMCVGKDVRRVDALIYGDFIQLYVQLHRSAFIQITTSAEIHASITISRYLLTVQTLAYRRNSRLATCIEL